MGRQPSIRKSSPLEVSLDEELRALLDIRLWSQAENRVPKGAYKTYLDRLLAVDLKGDRLDLAPYAGTLPGAATVTGSREAIAVLKETLEKNA
jgi:hypothetical protein